MVAALVVALAGTFLAPVSVAQDATPSPSPSPSSVSTPATSDASSPTATPSPEPTLPPLVMPTELGSWCQALFPPGSAQAEKKKAREIFGGSVDMGNGGIYRLSERPNWKPQSGTDTSGDRHVHSLYWALPLLYYGVHTNKPAMVDRFRQLMYYWVDDHKNSRGGWIDASIYGGLRTETLLCAAQTLNDPYLAEAAKRDARTMLNGFRSGRTISLGTNNTDLIRQTGALGVACYTGDTASRDKAWGNLVSIARGVVHDDGSDVEGSPGYAMYIEKLLRDVQSAAVTCGIPADPIPSLKGLLYQFVAQSVRPDFQLGSLGDTVNAPLRKTFGIGDWRADWIRSAGAAGAPPTPVYTAFDGGYAFGRAGWRPQPGGPDTYYSVRFSSTRPSTAHTHDDGGSVSIWSRGVQWVGDPGPYRYENGSSLRWYMKSRPAHSSMTVSNVSRTTNGGVRKLASRSDWRLGGNDLTCVDDRTYGPVALKRCVLYVRSVDAVIVVDYVDAQPVRGTPKQRQAAPVRVVTQRWQLPPGVGSDQWVPGVVGPDGVPVGSLSLAAADKTMDIGYAGNGVWNITSAKSKSSVGWFTGKWGEKLPGAVLSREVRLPADGGSQVLVTVFVPRTATESTPVTINPSGVTITRNGTTVTTPLPAKP